MCKNENEKWMSRCIQLAFNGSEGAPPNPMVGAVIVCDGKIIGEGYHRKYGEAHAEVNAIASVKNQSDLKRSTIYVSLEPCSHYGKTPPCADLIIEKGIPRVVVGTIDPFAKVKGHGISKMRAKGIDVVVGVLEEECRALNKHFMTYHTQKRPFVTLKWAQSLDGFIDRLRSEGEATKLSSPYTMMRVHRFRTEHQAILVGHKTALLDNPSLTIREWVGRQPLRVILSGKGGLPETLNLFKDGIPTLIVAREDENDYVGEHIETVHLPYCEGKGFHPQEVLSMLYEHSVQSLLVEGGSKVLQSFFDANLWDEFWCEQSPMILKEGVKAPQYSMAIPFECKTFGDRTYLHGVHNHYEMKA